MKFNYEGFEFEYSGQYVKDVLFIAISGAHSYGWKREDSDLDVRLVWFPDLTQALSVIHRGRTKQTQKDKIDFVSYPIHNFLGLLVKGNGNSLENLFQEKLYQHKNLVEELQKLTLNNLHLGFLKHYLGYYSTLKKDMNNPSRLEKYGIQKLILASYRVLRAGIILAKDKKVIYNLQEQTKNHASYMYKWILDDYLQSKQSSPKNIKDALKELDRLEIELKKYIAGVSWSPTFPSIVFDRWLVAYYKSLP